ncbi:pescadillo-like [Oppia nitens]|uniref:pescadillo-like n=1 Tax=Oppia nitens TaxID=1686743 RepID=UPI0023DC48F7|nr:pescadillo-like [Oppia nitens]
MGKIRRKGQSGARVAFVTRGQAIRRLQLSLKDFRRICILKGIHPVEPKNKKKTNSTGSSSNKTYYLHKDIQYLSHEPIIWKFWDFKIFMRRVVRAKGRKDSESVKRIRENKPFYKVDHIVRERYPTFIDALRDIDDGLSLCFLYAMFPKSRSLPLELIELSRRLTLEFLHYVIETKALRKVFISIKGYYYEADISGQTVRWVVPHQFVFDRISDVDFQVMRTFAEFYVTLLGFVNYKLYANNSLVYPPKIIDKSVTELEDMDSEQLVAALNKPLTSFINSDQLTKIDDFEEDIEEKNNSSELSFHQLVKFQNLFKGFKFFLNREVPRESLVFVIRCFGGEVSWDKSLHIGSTFDENDETITHQIVDREEIKSKYMNRFYIQPQWVFDCINAQILLPVQQYFIGAKLPPHLSPFVTESEGEYVPPERLALKKLQSNEFESNDNEDEKELQESDEEIPEPKPKKKKTDNESKDNEMSVRPGLVVKEDKERLRKQQESEEKRLAVLMIPKKKKKLYSKIMFGKKRSVREAEKLKTKRKEYDRKHK